LVVAANRVTRQIAEAMRGPEGDEAVKALDDRIGAAKGELSEAAAEARACLGEVNKLASLKEQILMTRKDNPYRAVGNAVVREGEVVAHGRPVSPSIILDQLVDGYEPRVEG
jgi:hypothetical protein